MIEYITIKTKNDVTKFVNSVKASESYDIEVDLCENFEFSKEHNKVLELIAKNVGKLKGNVRKLDFKVPYEKIPRAEFVKLCEIYKAFDGVMMGVNVEHWFFDGKSYDWFDDKEILNATQQWDIKTIIKANLAIDDVCKFVKDSNFSPMEAFAFIHNYVSTISKYSPTNDLAHTWIDKDQFFAGAYMDLPQVVCAGYSSLMKEIVESLNMPGLQCEIIAVPFENMLSCIKGSHARCLVKVNDEKYGINQSCYDDPTWDLKDENSGAKYTHFAMPNDCHDPRRNQKYEYYLPSIYKFSKSNASKEMEPIEASVEYNKSKNQIDQLMIEKVYFNVLQKINCDASEEKVYQALSKMAKDSFLEQCERKFVGNLKQQDLMLTKKDAHEIYCKNRHDFESKNGDLIY